MKQIKSNKSTKVCSKTKHVLSKKEKSCSVSIDPMMPRTYSASERRRLRNFENEVLSKK